MLPICLLHCCVSLSKLRIYYQSARFVTQCAKYHTNLPASPLCMWSNMQNIAAICLLRCCINDETWQISYNLPASLLCQCRNVQNILPIYLLPCCVSEATCKISHQSACFLYALMMKQAKYLTNLPTFVVV